MIQELLAVAGGIILGAIAGLLPAVHNNTIASLVLSLRLDLPAQALSLFIISLACAKLVFEFIPSIFLFIPNENSVLAVLPGHRLSLEGKGGFALRLSAFSALLSLFFCALLLPLALRAFPPLYSAVRPFTGPFLACACAFLLLSERGSRKIILASLVFLLSGILGLIVLRSPSFTDPLLPSFTGLFAVPAILLSFNQGQRIAQEKSPAHFNPLQFLPHILAGTLLGFLADLFPGLSSASQVAFFATLLIPTATEGFLALIASLSASHLFFSIAALFSAGKARVGATVAVKELLGNPSQSDSALLISGAILSFALSSALLLILAPKLVSLVSKINSRTLSISSFGFILLVVSCISGAQGLLVLFTASCVGMIAPLSGIRRTHVMALILVPAIFYQFGA